MRSLLVIFAVVVLLAGCERLPRPFQSEAPGDNDLLMLPDRSGIAVAPATGDVPGDGTALGAAMAEQLRAENIPADLGVGNSQSRWLLVHVDSLAEPADGPRGLPLRIAWELFEADGTPLSSYEQRLTVSAGPWMRGQPELLDSIVEEAAPRIARWVQGPEAEEAKLPGYPPGTALAVPDVASEESGAGAALSRALRRTLDARGLPLVENAQPGDVVIEGRLDLGPKVGSLVPLELVWTVRRAGEDETIGDLRQANQVPERELARGWPRLSRLIVQAVTPEMLRVVEAGAPRQESLR